MKDEEFQRLLDADFPVVLKPNWRRLALPISINFLLLVITFLYISLAVPIILVFSFFYWLILLSNFHILKIDKEKITSGKTIYTWDRIKNFRVVGSHTGGHTHTLKNEKQMIAEGIKPKFCMVGCDIAIENKIRIIFTPNSVTTFCSRSHFYGLTFFQLAQLMNHWRERALKCGELC